MIRQIIRYGIVVTVLAFVAGLLSLNYYAAAVLLLGAALAWPAAWLIRFLARRWKKLLLPSFFALAIAACLLYTRFFAPLYFSALPSQQMINGYHLTISNPDWGSEVFLLKETVILDPQWMEYTHETTLPASLDLPERKVTSSDIGFFTREVMISPGQPDPSGEVIITMPDGSTFKGPMCSFSCDKADIELLDIPRGSFLAARNAVNIQEHFFLDTETISWSVIDLSQGITFAFVRPPFNYVRPVIAPLLSVTALNQWLLGILGSIFTLVITPILRPVILSTAQKNFSAWLDRRRGGNKKKDQEQ
jgi:hypothetical protein